MSLIDWPAFEDSLAPLPQKDRVLDAQAQPGPDDFSCVCRTPQVGTNDLRRLKRQQLRRCGMSLTDTRSRQPRVSSLTVHQS